jgi:hypothetical protein
MASVWPLVSVMKKSTVNASWAASVSGGPLVTRIMSGGTGSGAYSRSPNSSTVLPGQKIAARNA